ncbi:MAG TPA: LysE family translocator [Steroidobacteraceae bacterium]|jgi:threonine/homoserine/homoserine lactone efflux protein
MTPLPSSFYVFVMAAFMLAITPGPGVLYVVTRTLRQGRKAGLASVFGVALGNLSNAAAASLGLAALLAASASAFTLVKLAGAAYLIFLGLRTFFAKPGDAAAPGSSKGLRRVFADGFVVALLNPKTALFFAALLPQFIDSAAAALLQSLMLAAVFVSIAACTDSLYVLTASALSRSLTKNPAAQSLGRIASALTFIGLGIFAALASPRTSR